MAEFSFVHGPVNELMEGLNNGKIDLLFLRNCIREDEELSYQILEEESLQLVIHKDLDPQPEVSTLRIEY